MLCLFYSSIGYLIWSQSAGLSPVLLFCGLPQRSRRWGTRGNRWEQLRTGMNRLKQEQAGRGEHWLVRKGRPRHVQAGMANYREQIASWGYVRVCLYVLVCCVLPIWQVLPVQPGGQRHWKPWAVSRHVAPRPHGWESQCSTATYNKWDSKQNAN